MSMPQRKTVEASNGKEMASMDLASSPRPRAVVCTAHTEVGLGRGIGGGNPAAEAEKEEERRRGKDSSEKEEGRKKERTNERTKGNGSNHGTIPCGKAVRGYEET